MTGWGSPPTSPSRASVTGVERGVPGRHGFLPRPRSPGYSRRRIHDPKSGVCVALPRDPVYPEMVAAHQIKLRENTSFPLLLTGARSTPASGVPPGVSPSPPSPLPVADRDDGRVRGGTFRSPRLAPSRARDPRGTSLRHQKWFNTCRPVYKLKTLISDLICLQFKKYRLRTQIKPRHLLVTVTLKTSCFPNMT